MASYLMKDFNTNTPSNTATANKIYSMHEDRLTTNPSLIITFREIKLCMYTTLGFVDEDNATELLMV